MEQRKAIVLGSHVNALSLVRALGRKGVYVVIVDRHRRGRRPLAYYSKHVKEFALAPDPYEEGDGFPDFLLGKISEWAGAIIVPTDDFQLDSLSKHRAELSRYYVVAVANRRAIETAVNKRMAHEHASRLEIPAPNTLFPEGPEHVARLASNVNYPCILKPVTGHVFRHHKGAKVIEVDSPASLCSEYDRLHTRYPMMIQEVVEGDDSNIVLYAAYFDPAGEPLAEFTGRKVRQIPPRFGDARVAESIHSPEAVTLGRAILGELGYGGSIVGVEFKYDDRDNRLKFLEINARSQKWHSLIEASGMNLPWIMYQDLVLGRKARQFSHEVNVFWIHGNAEIRTVARCPRPRISRMMEYLSPHFSRRTFAVYDRKDVKPALRECYGLFEDLLLFAVRACGFVIRKTRQRL